MLSFDFEGMPIGGAPQFPIGANFEREALRFQERDPVTYLARKLIVIDGTTCEGKSTLVARLSRRAFEAGVANLAVDEFSSSFLGDGIRGLIAKNDFVTFDHSHPLNLTETLTLLADLSYRFEFEIAHGDRNRAFIVDRGALSLIAFQAARLTCGGEDELLDRIALLQPAFNPFLKLTRNPDHYVVLKVAPEERSRRFAERYGRAMTDNEESMMARVDLAIRYLSPQFNAVVIDTDGKSPEKACDECLELIRSTSRELSTI